MKKILVAVALCVATLFAPLPATGIAYACDYVPGVGCD